MKRVLPLSVSLLALSLTLGPTEAEAQAVSLSDDVCALPSSTVPSGRLGAFGTRLAFPDHGTTNALVVFV